MTYWASTGTKVWLFFSNIWPEAVRTNLHPLYRRWHFSAVDYHWKSESCHKAYGIAASTLRMYSKHNLKVKR